jgi:hypothetical protein
MPGEGWLARLAEKARSARTGQNARTTGRLRLPPAWMVTGFGAGDRGALLVIRSWCTDGALLLGRGPVNSHVPPSKADRTGISHVPNQLVRPLTGVPWTDEWPRRRGSSPARLPCHSGRQSQGSRIHRIRPWRTGDRRARSHQRGIIKMKQINPSRNSLHRFKTIR